MGLQFCSLASGSSGNSYIVKTEETLLVVDAGISCRKIINGIEAIGCTMEEADGVLLTHEHIDHVKSVGTVCKKLSNARFYASAGTFIDIEEKIPEERRTVITAGSAFTIGDIEVKPFHLSHDAKETTGYAFHCEGKSIAIVTDTGVVTEEIHDHVASADILVLEANHDVEMLRFGRYPYMVQQRILGEFGHLSNDLAAEELKRIFREDGKYRQVFLAHLSKENNFPELALQTIKNALDEENLMIGRDLGLEILPRDTQSALYVL